MLTSALQAVHTSQSLHLTSYTKLAKSSTVDFSECDPKVKNFSFYMKEKLLYEPNSFDKYSKRFYDNQSEVNDASRKEQDGLFLRFIDKRENKTKYSGEEASSKRASKKTHVADDVAMERARNFKALSVELSGGPPLFYYDPDGSRCVCVVLCCVVM